MMITNKYQEKPIEIFGRMSSLMSNSMDLSCCKKYADNIYTIIGISYIAMAIHLLHNGCLGRFMVFLLSVIMMLTFDNPLFNDSYKNEKIIACIMHFITFITAFSLCCGNCHKNEDEMLKKVKENVEEPIKKESDKKSKKAK